MRLAVRRELLRTTAFIRAVRRHLKKHPHARSDVEATLERLAADAFETGLKTHKLSGELEGVWACSASYDLRILFEFVQHDGREAILLISMGNHDEVY
jgi:mRNA-degrading endonuclease YafQ of YafQ-DinJ toxin-antitoxin module